MEENWHNRMRHTHTSGSVDQSGSRTGAGQEERSTGGTKRTGEKINKEFQYGKR